MKGAYFAGGSEIGYLDVPDPTPGPGEAVLAMKASGMCGSDLKLYRTPKGASISIARVKTSGPVIAGHEPCGQVVAVGSGVGPHEAKVGDRMMVHHYWGCSTCDHCRAGWSQLCTTMAPEVYGIGAHGGHAPFLKVPARTLVPLPESLSYEAGAAISCGTGTAYQALRRMNVSGHDTVAIFGQGPVGLAGTQLAAALGARVIALDVNPARLAMAKHFGAAETVNPKETDAVEAIKELTGGRGADAALECSAAPEARVAAIFCLRIWGVACMVGGSGPLHLDNVSAALNQRQITVMGSWTFSNVGQADCARFIAERGVEADKVFTHRWRLDQADEAYKLFDRQSDGKGVIMM